MQEKPRLLMTASTFPRHEKDTEPRFVLDLAIALTPYFEVTVLVPGAIGAKEEEQLEGVTVIRYRYFPIKKWETLCYPGAIVPRIKQKKARIFLVPFLFLALYFNLKNRLPAFDVVHAHWIIPQGILQCYFKKPYLLTGHGGDVTSLNIGIMRKWKQKALQKAGAITTVSTALKAEIQNLVPNKAVEVLSMGCKVKQFGKQYYAPNLFNQGEKKVILFVGRLAEKKGVMYLIEAMKQVDAKLIIAGDGPLKEALEKQAEAQQSDIQFIGPKTHDELRTIYASADIFVAPSVTAKDGDKEGFGLVLLEAMASGLAVVGSRSGGIPDLIRDNENGLLAKEKDAIDLAEKINQLIKNESLRQKLSTQAIETAKQYDYGIIGERYAAILMKLLEKGK